MASLPNPAAVLLMPGLTATGLMGPGQGPAAGYRNVVSLTDLRTRRTTPIRWAAPYQGLQVGPTTTPSLGAHT